jgi:WD40 repeat protein
MMRKELSIKFAFISFVSLCIPFLVLGVSLQEEMPGAKVWFRSGSSMKFKDISSGEIKTLVGSGAIGTTKISGDGRRVLSASGSQVKVFDTETGDLVYSKPVSISGRDNNGWSAEINWDGTKIFYCKGSKSKMIIYSLSVPGGDIKEVFTSYQGIAEEGEFCMSKDENRFVGRYSSNKAVYVDVEKNQEGKYADHCSPCISPDGTRCAVNCGDHSYVVVYKWRKPGSDTQRDRSRHDRSGGNRSSVG